MSPLPVRIMVRVKASSPWTIGYKEPKDNDNPVEH